MLDAILALAQDATNITFTSSALNGRYCHFTMVDVTNRTKDWSLQLVYPDTVLTLANTLGVFEGVQQYSCFYLNKVYPNPFSSETSAELELFENGEILLQVFQPEESIVASKRVDLMAGTYRINIGLKAPQLAYLAVTSRNGYQRCGLVHSGYGIKNTIDIDLISSSTSTTRTLKDNFNYRDYDGAFDPGDLMNYRAILVLDDDTLYSNVVEQQQFDDDTLNLRFNIDLPSVTTNDVIEITHNSAKTGGNVIDDGNAPIIERGICWDTNPNATINSAHATSGVTIGPYTISMTNLSAQTLYFVRSYAINGLGVSYGEEKRFITEDLPSYTVEVTANLNNGGVVSGGGSYQLGQTCTLQATTSTDYYFVGWEENGEQISTDTFYTFTVSDDCHIVACFFPSYHFYEGQCQDYSLFERLSHTELVYSSYDSLMAIFPAYVAKSNIGAACDGQNLYCYEFGGEQEINKPKIIIICSQHGFEKNSAYGTYYFLKDVATNNETNPFLSYVHDNLHLIVVPVVNPSGFDAFIYKNANGVNLNRNWPVLNWTFYGDPSSSNYSGLAPLDQPETRVVDSIININLDADLFIDFHTNGMGVLGSANQLNWISIPVFEDTIKRGKLLELTQIHLDSVTTNFKRIYGGERPVFMDSPQLGYISNIQHQYTTGFAEESMAQRGILSICFEGFNGFPEDSTSFMPGVAKANSELIGNYIYQLCYYYYRWKSVTNDEVSEKM